MATKSKKKPEAPTADEQAPPQSDAQTEPRTASMSEAPAVPATTPANGETAGRKPRQKKGAAAAAPEPETAPKAQADSAPASASQAAPASASRTAAAKPKKAKKPATDVTLKQLAERYIEALENEGKSDGTLFSYRLEMRSALAELGEETRVADLSVARVEAFFACERVTKTRTGREKSPLSIAKTRRVLTQALAFAEEEGIVEKAPLPDEAEKA